MADVKAVCSPVFSSWCGKFEWVVPGNWMCVMTLVIIIVKWQGPLLVVANYSYVASGRYLDREEIAIILTFYVKWEH